MSDKILELKKAKEVWLDEKWHKEFKAIWILDNKINTSKEYSEKWFLDKQRRNHQISFGNEFLYINKSETTKVISNAKGNKARGPDKIHEELLKMVEHEFLDPVIDLFNHTFRTGKIPKYCVLLNVVPIPRMTNAEKCEVFRLVS